MRVKKVGERGKGFAPLFCAREGRERVCYPSIRRGETKASGSGPGEGLGEFHSDISRIGAASAKEGRSAATRGLLMALRK